MQHSTGDEYNVQLTTHKVVNNGIDSTICIAHPMRQQSQGRIRIILRQLHQ